MAWAGGVDTEARALMQRIADLSQQLRSDCGSFDFLGDEDACANSADQIDAWLASRGPRLLVSSEAGDESAHNGIVTFCHKMLDFLRTAYSDISAGDTLGDLAASIGDDAKKKLGAGLKLGPWIIGGLVVLFVVVKAAK